MRRRILLLLLFIIRRFLCLLMGRIIMIIRLLIIRSRLLRFLIINFSLRMLFFILVLLFPSYRAVSLCRSLLLHLLVSRASLRSLSHLQAVSWRCKHLGIGDSIWWRAHQSRDLENLECTF